MGWWIALGILVLLCSIPFGVRVRYDEAGFRAWLLAGWIRFQVFPLPGWLKKPRKKKEEPAQKPSEPKQPEQPKEEPSQEPPKSGGSIGDFLPFVGLGLDFLKAFPKKLHMNNLELHIVMAGDDPCDLALGYGGTWAAVGNLLPALERIFVIQKRNIDISCDFLAESVKIIAGMDITITIGRILGLLAVFACRAVKLLIDRMKTKKGGAQA